MKNQSVSKNDVALLMIRGIVGVVFLFHGSQKLFGAFDGPGIAGMAGFNESLGIPFPVLSAWLASLTEFAGGAALLTGVGQRLISVPLAFTMLVASFVAHGGAFSAQAGGMEYPLTLTIIVAALGIAGPGSLTVLNALANRAKSSTVSTTQAHPATR